MKIVVFSDGTGNSSAKLFRTNVWRLYEALDLSDESEQVAYYDNGVGTAAFRPLALLGGAFGWGLKRNVLDIYTFICRHAAQPGQHRISAFGFSRGAFTIRILLGLMRRQGLVPYTGDDRELRQRATWAYREYRAKAAPGNAVVGALRRVRDAWLRAIGRGPKDDARSTVHRVPVSFVGLWDTVGAYGFPIIEMTRGWDKWVWPLSLPTRVLWNDVEKACHALALDDERQTFHPLLWDEHEEPTIWRGAHEGGPAVGTIADERISQVWFAGMHSNVGGGYPDDGMSYESLCWIAGHAASGEHGIALKPDALEEWQRRCTVSAPMLNSRHGVGAYYRYLPRLVSASSNDAASKVHVALPKIHTSVLRRIGAGVGGYAPIGLPSQYAVTDGTTIVDLSSAPLPEPDARIPETRNQAVARGNSQAVVWDAVWFRRIAYFLTVVVTLKVLIIPFLPETIRTRILPWPLDSLSSLVAFAGGMLPGLASPIIDHYRKFPVQLLAGALVVVGLMSYSTWQERRVRDVMRKIWRREEFPTPTIWLKIARKIRTSPAYITALDTLRYVIAPHTFGLAMFLIIATAIGVAATRLSFDLPMLFGGVCRSLPAADLKPWTGSEIAIGALDTKNPCQNMKVALERGVLYEISVTPPAPAWLDRTKPVTSLAGFPSDSWVFYLARPLRRHQHMNWFVPVARIGGYGEEYYPITATPTWFRPQVDGQLFMYVNDALTPYPWLFLYGNNGDEEGSKPREWTIRKVEGQ
jgi:uncharacterized protein (DUF2235 family)